MTKHTRLLTLAVLSALPAAAARGQAAAPSGPSAAASAGAGAGAMAAPAGQASPSSEAGAPAQANKVGTGGSAGPAPYTLVRWNEDYSYLKDPSKRSDLFDPIKYIRLGRDDVYLSLGGQLRERYEYFNNNAFSVGTQDEDGYYLTRALVNADLHVGQYFRAFGQIKTAMEDGREGGFRPTDSDEFDVQQAFVDGIIPLGGKDSVTVRFGRQDLLYGAQRLIGPLDWTNVRRTFEGVKVSANLGNHTLDAFLVRPVVVSAEEPNDGSPEATFSGVYDTITLPELLPGANTKLELYGLVLNQNNLGAVGTGPSNPAESDTYTLGFRFSTNPKPWDLDVEIDYQFGQTGQDGRISAYSVALEGGYTFAGAPLKPRLFFGFDAASGDDDPTDRDSERFNQLFPTGHLYFGYIDVIGRSNIIDVHPGVELALLEKQKFVQKMSLRAEYHLFWRYSTDDGIVNAGGGTLRADGGSDASYVGSEIDLLLNWQIDRHAAAYLGYSHFFAGDFIQQTGPSDDIDFFYAAVQFTF